MPVAVDSPVLYSLHGLAVQLGCELPWLSPQIGRILGEFAVDHLPEGFVPTAGLIQPYQEDQVLRHLSPSAVRVNAPTGLVELYQDAERFWLIDERVGLVEVNFLKSQWRAFVLPQPTTDEVRIIELTVLWPLSQLLRARGLWLLPAVSIVRAGWGVMLLAPFSVEPELRALLHAGWRIIGQRWSAIREDGPRLEMLHVPGEVEVFHAPHLRDTAATSPAWIDLAEDHIGCAQNHAFLDAVLVAEPGRRQNAHMNELAPSRAVEAMRANWPVVDIHPNRRIPNLPLKLAQRARCAELQLSRNPADLLVLLDSLKYSRPVKFAAEAPATIRAAG